MGTTDIRDYILNKFQEDSIEITDVWTGDNYFLFDLGKDSVTKFRIKGCRRWLFGLWVIEQSTKDGPTTYQVELFGQHTDYIDKFKPSCSPISESSTDVKSLSDLDDMIYLFGISLNTVKSSPLLARYRYYFKGYAGGLNPYLWLLDEAWYYRVKAPLRNLLETKFNKVYGKIIVFWWNLRYHKILEATYRETQYFSPKHEIDIRYTPEATNDDMYKLWHKLNGSIGYGRCIRVSHYEPGQNRPFYYRECDNDDDS